MFQHPSRTVRLAAAGLALLTAATLPAHSFDDLDPTDVLPRRYSVEDFRNLSDAELYMVNLAIKRGRIILINGYPPSESRRMIQDAARGTH